MFEFLAPLLDLTFGLVILAVELGCVLELPFTLDGLDTLLGVLLALLFTVLGARYLLFAFSALDKLLDSYLVREFTVRVLLGELYRVEEIFELGLAFSGFNTAFLTDWFGDLTGFIW